MERTRRTKALITILSGLFSIAVTAAVWSPATEYELSIYASTPLVVWIPVVLLAGVGAISIVYLEGRQRIVGAVSIAASSLFILALPLLRSYYFLGTADPMTYAGLSRHIVATGAVTDMIYPGLPTLAAILNEVTSIQLEQVWLLLLVALALTFVLGSMLTVRHIDGRTIAICLSLVVAGLFLPLNQITRAGVFTPPSTTTATIFLTPLFIYFTIRVTESRNFNYWFLAFLALLAIIFFHPQQAVNAFIVATTVGVAYSYHQTDEDVRVTRHLRYYTIVLAAGLVFWLWVSTSTIFENAFGVIVLRLLSPSGTGDVGDVGGSLAVLGASIPELFVKIFLVSAIAGLVVGVALVLALAPVSKVPRRLRPVSRMPLPEQSLALSIIPIGQVFAIYLVVTSQYLRHLGFLMAVVTIVFPLTVARASSISEVQLGGLGKSAVVVLLAVALVLSGLTLHYSPWVYQDSKHVTETQVSGYEHSFQYMETGTEVGYLRLYPYRFWDLLRGTPTSTTRQFQPQSVPVTYELRDAVDSAPNKRYYVVTEADKQRDFELYDEAFLRQGDVEYLETESGRVYDNGEFELYLKPA